MLYIQTVSTFLFETLEHLMKLESLQGFRLVVDWNGIKASIKEELQVFVNQELQK